MFRIRKYGWAILSLLMIWMTVMTPAACRAESGADSQADPRTVTVMIYLTGSDLESGQGAATADLLEMMDAGFDADQVNVILFAGGSTRWYSGFPADSCGIYRIGRDQSPESLLRTELMNMGDPATLTFFLNWCAENSPAERYDLILWDHGGGPILGVCADRLFDGDTLTLGELSEALDASPFRDGNALEMIGFDACLMGTVEMASVCAPYARYMVASEEVEPGGGWNYSYLKDLEKDQNGAATGQRIIDLYFETNSRNAENGARLSMTCFDLSGRTALREKMDTLFTDLAGQLTESSFGSVSRLRESSESIGRKTGVEYDLVDLEDLLSRYNTAENRPAGEALESLTGMKVYHRGTEPALSGLSVYFPYYNKEKYSEGWSTVYGELESGSGYSRYVSLFGKYLTGAPFAGWQNLMTQQTEDGINESCHFTLQLSEEQQEHMGSATLLIARKKAYSFVYQFVYEETDVTVDAEGVLHAYYSGDVLYATDRDGNRIGEPLTFRKAGDTFLISCVLSGDSEENGTVPATIACARDARTGDLRMTGVYARRGDGMAEALRLEDWNTITVQAGSDGFALDGKDQYLPFERETGETSGLHEISVSDFAGFEMRRETITNENGYAVFQLTDTQNNTYGSHPVFIKKMETKTVQQTGTDTGSGSVRTAEGDFTLSNTDGLAILAEPSVHLLSPGQSISVLSRYSGNYQRVREKIIGFEVLVNGSFYRKYGQKDFACSIPQRDWVGNGTLNRKKTVVEVIIIGNGGGGYARDVFYLSRDENWTCEGHRFVFVPGDHREYRPCASEPGKHYLYRTDGHLVCQECGERKDAGIVTFSEADSPEKTEHVYDRPLPGGGTACVCGAENARNGKSD